MTNYKACVYFGDRTPVYELVARYPKLISFLNDDLLDQLCTCAKYPNIARDMYSIPMADNSDRGIAKILLDHLDYASVSSVELISSTLSYDEISKILIPHLMILLDSTDSNGYRFVINGSYLVFSQKDGLRWLM